MIKRQPRATSGFSGSTWVIFYPKEYTIAKLLMNGHCFVAAWMLCATPSVTPLFGGVHTLPPNSIQASKYHLRSGARGLKNSCRLVMGLSLLQNMTMHLMSIQCCQLLGTPCSQYRRRPRFILSKCLTTTRGALSAAMS